MTDEPSSGYKRPPRANRFKAGASGNPRGRPKGSRNLKADLTKLLKKRIAVREDGQLHQISRQEAMLLALFGKAVRGDVKATNSILAMCMKLDPPQELRDESTKVSESDQAIINDFLRRRAAEIDGNDHG
jgi:hypothetical protein